MNGSHLAERGPSDPTDGPGSCVRDAARMQVAVPAALHEQETAETRALYGLDEKGCAGFARNCLMPPPVGKGSAFVQLWSGSGPTWDSHGDVPGQHAAEAALIDRPSPACCAIWPSAACSTTRCDFHPMFGRTPFAQSAAGTLGQRTRSHQNAFSVWMGVPVSSPASPTGATDDFGGSVSSNPVSNYDFHATILHLLGIDHERLTFYHNGIQRRLTNVHGHVVHELIA